jgi:hypothetical protein
MAVGCTYKKRLRFPFGRSFHTQQACTCQCVQCRRQAKPLLGQYRTDNIPGRDVIRGLAESIHFTILSYLKLTIALVKLGLEYLALT